METAGKRSIFKSGYLSEYVDTLLQKVKIYINSWEIYVFLQVMIQMKSQERLENFQSMYFTINRRS